MALAMSLVDLKIKREYTPEELTAISRARWHGSRVSLREVNSLPMSEESIANLMGTNRHQIRREIEELHDIIWTEIAGCGIHTSP